MHLLDFEKGLSEKVHLEGRLGFVRSLGFDTPVKPLLYHQPPGTPEHGEVLSGNVLFLSNPIDDDVIPRVRVYSFHYQKIGYIYLASINLFSFLEDFDEWEQFVKVRLQKT